MAEQAEESDPDKAFSDRAEAAFRDLFERAKAAHELHFAMALMPEMRGMQDAGWNTAQENVKAYDQFLELVEELDSKRPVRVRVALSLYLYVTEASGLYEVPEKLMLTVKGNNMMPFKDIVNKHPTSGAVIAPNANKVMKDLIGQATEVGLHELADVLDKAVDADIRNGAAHADYILWNDGVRLPRKNGGQMRVIGWDQFHILLNRAIGLFHIVRQLVGEYQHSYTTPKTIRASLNNEPETDWTIYSVRGSGFGFTSGKPPTAPEGYL